MAIASRASGSVVPEPSPSVVGRGVAENAPMDDFVDLDALDIDMGNEKTLLVDLTSTRSSRSVALSETIGQPCRFGASVSSKSRWEVFSSVLPGSIRSDGHRSDNNRNEKRIESTLSDNEGLCWIGLQGNVEQLIE